MDADEFVGKTVLVGLTYLNADGSVREQEQWHGVIVAFDPEDGVRVRLPSGEIETLPPTLEKGGPGDYTLRSTGEVVSDPDFVCTWTITAPGDPTTEHEEEAVEKARTDDEWIDVYTEQRSLYNAFAERLEDLLETLLDEEGLAYAWVLRFSVDPATLDGILNKARRDREALDNPLESPLRVAGVTIGVETQQEASEIEELIGREFVVDPTGSLSIEEAAARNERLRDPVRLDTLTYEFPYYLVGLDERRLELAEWSRYAGLKARIELKTLLHDAWNGIDLELPFELASSYPVEVRDLLARCALDLSAVDAHLAEAKRAIDQLLADYDDAVAAGDLQLPVNGVSLLAYLRTSELVRSLSELGHEIGLRYDPEYSPNWDAVERRSLWLLRRADVHTLAELEDFLRQATPRARDTLRELAQVAIDRDFTPWAFPEAVVEWLWLVLRRADAETIALLNYHEAIVYALNTLIGNRPSADGPDET